MLMETKILKHKYFQAVHMKSSNMMDPLTGTLTRTTAIDYLDYMIARKIHFSLCVMDIDNFKRINDTYGHTSGDEVLESAAKNVMLAMSDCCSIGRFGGDEFLLIFEGIDQYEDLYAQMEKIYKFGLHKNIHLSMGKNLTITCTSGLCSYPKDGEDYTDLFNLCDKCLYFGKQKGRNNFTIYVEFLHKNVDITKSAKKNMSERIMQLYKTFDQSEKKIKVYKAMEYLTNDISISGIAYIYKNRIRISYERNEDYGLPPVFPEKYLGALEKKDFLKIDDYTNLENKNPILYKFCYENNLLSYIIYKVEIADKNLGYVIFYDSDFKRIWQDDDIALFTIFIKTLATIAHFGNV